MPVNKFKHREMYIQQPCYETDKHEIPTWRQSSDYLDGTFGVMK
jgi:hypothetical protein